MSDPICPARYDCTFVPHPPKAPTVWHPWWESTTGWIAAGVVVVAVVLVLWLLAESWTEARKAKQQRLAAEAQGRDRLAMAEQLTMQIDAAHGDPEMLTIVRDLQRTLK